MPVSPHRLQRRVDFLLRRRAFMSAPAQAFVLAYYRRHRRLPPAYVTSLLPNSTLRRIQLRGEAEHLLGLTAVFRLLVRLRHGN
jgi:hypothetical protein